MTEKKKPAAKKQRRRVSKPRLLREIQEQMEEANLTSDSSCGELIGAIEDSIIKEAVANS